MEKIWLILMGGVLLLSLWGCARVKGQPAMPTEAQAETFPSAAAPAAPETTAPEPEDTDFVRVADYLPQVPQYLPYSTAENFTGAVIYDFSGAYLRYGTVKKLMAAQAALEAQGLSLKIWDAFRPTAAQFRLWEVCPDPNFVANPNRGFSAHSRGNTVDVTLVDSQGAELLMPTAFDDFTPKADRDYRDCEETERQNALLLEEAMLEAGFIPYSGEWWHFQDEDTYPVEEVFCPEA